jgi:membrane protease YdiL (CAAX protease family)
VARLVMREGIADVSFRFGGRRTLTYIALGLVFPIVVGFVSYGIAWTTGLAGFGPRPVGWVVAITGEDAAPVTVFVAALILAATVGTAVGALTAAGEEIGWRGYMLTRLIEAGVPHPILVSGLIWGVWHLPLVGVGAIYADHPAIAVAALVFVVAATAMGFVIARFRLETGSIWPAIALHAAYNSVIQSAFDPARSGGAVWVDMEAGVLVALTLVVAAGVLCRGRWTYRKTPDRLLAPPFPVGRTR